MAFTDVSVLLPVLVRIAEALEAANVIAKANCPDVSPPLLSSSSPAPTIGVIPEVQISTPGVEATRPVSSTLVSIPGELFDCSVRGEGEDPLSICVREGAEGQREGSSCRFGGSLSSCAACDCCTCSFESCVTLPTALSPRPRPCSLSPHPHPLFLPQIGSQTDSVVVPPPSFGGSDIESIWCRDGETSSIGSSSIASTTLVFSFEGEPLQGLEGNVAYCGI